MTGYQNNHWSLAFLFYFGQGKKCAPCGYRFFFFVGEILGKTHSRHASASVSAAKERSHWKMTNGGSKKTPDENEEKRKVRVIRNHPDRRILVTLFFLPLEVVGESTIS